MSAGPEAAAAGRPIVTYRLRGGTPPPDDEQLTVSEDGSFSLWRTRAQASRPPTDVGRFSGALDHATVDALRQIVARCSGTASAPLPFTPGASIESFVLGMEEQRAAGDAALPGPWGELAQVVRALLVRLTAHPEAALGLEERAGRWLLTRRGTGQLRVDLSGARVRVVRWVGDAPVEVHAGRLDGPRDQVTESGWIHDLGHEVAAAVVADGAAYTVTVDRLLLHGGSFWHVAGLYARVEPAAHDLPSR